MTRPRSTDVLAPTSGLLVRRCPDRALVLGEGDVQSLLGSAAAIWDAFAGGRTCDEVVAALARTFDGDLDAIRDSVAETAAALLAADLLEVVDP